MRWLLLSGVLILVLAGAFYGTRSPGISNDNDYAGEKTRSVTVAVLVPITPVLDIEAAYRAIPHQRTVFHAGAAQMPPGESAYLSALFQLTDIGVAERVYLQDRLLRGQVFDPTRTNYPAILQGMRSLATPAGLLPVEELIHEALQEQRDYLDQWAQKGDPEFFDPEAPLISSSHGKLIAAYQLLIRRYGAEPAQNHQAFYDHLCALDFI